MLPLIELYIGVDSENPILIATKGVQGGRMIRKEMQISRVVGVHVEMGS